MVRTPAVRYLQRRYIREPGAHEVTASHKHGIGKDRNMAVLLSRTLPLSPTIELTTEEPVVVQ